MRGRIFCFSFLLMVGIKCSKCVWRFYECLKMCKAAVIKKVEQKNRDSREISAYVKMLVFKLWISHEKLIASLECYPCHLGYHTLFSFFLSPLIRLTISFNIKFCCWWYVTFLFGFIQIINFNPTQDRLLTDGEGEGGGAKNHSPPSLSKICQISQIDETWYNYTLAKEAPKKHELRDTPLGFCWH